MNGRTVSPTQVLFLDYQVLDHMHRMDTGKYTGTSAAELAALRQAVVAGDIEIWMSRITLVEMAIGLENPNLTPGKSATYRQKDEDKLSIARSMCVQWLTYPASRSDDWDEHSMGYSRADLTLRSDPFEDWSKANALEKQLLKLDGVSKKGDAPQVVSCVYGRANDTGQRPAIRWFVTEDRNLRRALTKAQAGNAVSELVGLQVCSVKDFVNSMTAGQ